MPTVTWLKDGMPVKEAELDYYSIYRFLNFFWELQYYKKNINLIKSSVETKYEDGICILRISKAPITASGAYVCVAENARGRAETSCHVSIIGSRSLKY